MSVCRPYYKKLVINSLKILFWSCQLLSNKKVALLTTWSIHELHGVEISKRHWVLFKNLYAPVNKRNTPIIGKINHLHCQARVHDLPKKFQRHLSLHLHLKTFVLLYLPSVPSRYRTNTTKKMDQSSRFIFHNHLYWYLLKTKINQKGYWDPNSTSYTWATRSGLHSTEILTEKLAVGSQPWASGLFLFQAGIYKRLLVW